MTRRDSRGEDQTQRAGWGCTGSVLVSYAGFWGSPVLGRAGEERVNSSKKSQFEEPRLQGRGREGSAPRPGGIADQRPRVVSRTTLQGQPGPHGKMTLMAGFQTTRAGF